ncbi:site-specific integrase [Candidatus Tisiphia endosymbiont of Xenochironomus xenolabis]|uniref:site-specific integrase n=1 Tax=unclassified Candidatus Tisiphia TaxID=2996318 RepID=UPI0035C8EEE5
MTNPLFHFTNKAIEKNPTRNIEVHKKEIRRRFIGTKEAMSKFFEVINAEPNRKMADFFLMLLFTRARKGEVLSMRWQDINFENREWYLRDQATKVYLVKDAITILERRQKDNHTESIWVFPGNDSSTHLQEPKRAWKRICQLAGIDNLRIHDLRRTYGSLIRKAGANKEGIMQALGLKDIRSTKIYDSTESDQAEVKEFMEKAIQNLMLPEDTVTSQTKIADNIETQQRENEARQRKIEEPNNK